MKLIASHLQNKNPPDAYGYTPLHAAAASGFLDIVMFLTEQIEDKNPSTTDFWDKRTPLHEAARKGHLNVVTYLVSLVPDPNVQSKIGKTPYDLAVDNGQEKIIEYLAKYVDY